MEAIQVTRTRIKRPPVLTYLYPIQWRRQHRFPYSTHRDFAAIWLSLPATACDQQPAVIDLTRGYYDPYTQVYTIPLQAGGDTDGGTISTGYWTEKGDGTTPTKEWDITDDRVTD